MSVKSVAMCVILALAALLLFIGSVSGQDEIPVAPTVHAQYYIVPIESHSSTEYGVGTPTPVITPTVTATPTRTPTPYPTISPLWTPRVDYYEPNEIRIIDVNKTTNEITIKNFSVRDIYIRWWFLEDAPETWQCRIEDTKHLAIGESRTFQIDTLCGLTEDLMTIDDLQDYVLLTNRYVVMNFVRK